MTVNTKKALVTGNAPLHTWDIFIYSYKRRMLLQGDLQRLQQIETQYNWAAPPVPPDYMLIWLNKVVMVTTPTLQIIHATENVFDMTGYTPNEVIGKRPSMFQGKDTEEFAKRAIRTGVDTHTHFEVNITNYKKDGTSYRCHVDGYPIFNKAGVLVNFVAFEKETKRA